MTTYMHETQKCSVCGAAVDCQVLGSTNACGSSDLDLRPPEMKRSTMRCWLHACPRCNYVNYDLRQPIKNAKATLESPAYAALVADADAPPLALLFARYAMLQHADAEAAGVALVRAAWACDDAADQQRAKSFRQQAADRLLALRPFADDEQQATLATSLVDVLRRAERCDEARSLAQSLLEYEAVQENEIVVAVLQFQCRLCDAHDVGCYTVADCR